MFLSSTFCTRVASSLVTKIAFPLTIALLVSTFLSSCSQPIVDEVKPIQLNQQQLKQLSDLPLQWDLKGRFAIIYNDQSWHVHFHWLKNINQFHLRFTGPLGETRILLEQKKINDITQNILTIGKETHTSSEPIDKFLYSHTNMLIPVKSLQYWLFGHYNPQHPYQIKQLSSEDEFSSSIKELFQESWQIKFSQYEKSNGFNYPTKITAKNGEYKLKVFVSSRSEI
jgi:outer membrane lipoprotein LolB